MHIRHTTSCGEARLWFLLASGPGHRQDGAARTMGKTQRSLLHSSAPRGDYPRPRNHRKRETDTRHSPGVNVSARFTNARGVPKSSQSQERVKSSHRNQRRRDGEAQEPTSSTLSPGLGLLVMQRLSQLGPVPLVPFLEAASRRRQVPPWPRPLRPGATRHQELRRECRHSRLGSL